MTFSGHSLPESRKDPGELVGGHSREPPPPEKPGCGASCSIYTRAGAASVSGAGGRGEQKGSSWPASALAGCCQLRAVGCPLCPALYLSKGTFSQLLFLAAVRGANCPLWLTDEETEAQKPSNPGPSGGPWWSRRWCLCSGNSKGQKNGASVDTARWNILEDKCQGG